MPFFQVQTPVINLESTSITVCTGYEPLRNRRGHGYELKLSLAFLRLRRHRKCWEKADNFAPFSLQGPTFVAWLKHILPTASVYKDFGKGVDKRIHNRIHCALN